MQEKNNVFNKKPSVVTQAIVNMSSGGETDRCVVSSDYSLLMKIFATVSIGAGVLLIILGKVKHNESTVDVGAIFTEMGVAVALWDLGHRFFSRSRGTEAELPTVNPDAVPRT